MKELGRILQTTRESKHLTLDEIQERTKIRKRYLQAIEQGDLSILPGLVYARGFIKSYAEQLELDGQALLREYGLLEETTVFPAAELKQAEEKQRDEKQIRSKSVFEQNSSTLPQVVMGAVIIGLIGIGYWFLSNPDSDQESPVSPPSQQQPATPPATNPVPVPGSSPSDSPADQTKPKEQLKPETKTNKLSVYKVSGDKIKLDVEAANGDCWLDIRVDGATKYSQVAPKGTSLSFEGGSEILVASGFSPALRVTVNGQAVELEPATQRYDYRFLKR